MSDDFNQSAAFQNESFVQSTKPTLSLPKFVFMFTADCKRQFALVGTTARNPEKEVASAQG